MSEASEASELSEVSSRKNCGSSRNFFDITLEYIVDLKYNQKDKTKKVVFAINRFDVAVCGGGFAGISAALAAAREGKKVVLFEKEYMLGGLGTAGLVTIYLPLAMVSGAKFLSGLRKNCSGFPSPTVRKRDTPKTGSTALAPKPRRINALKCNTTRRSLPF
jgi:alkyl hydroperoxide reductase subunit AhpF